MDQLITDALGKQALFGAGWLVGGLALGVFLFLLGLIFDKIGANDSAAYVGVTGFGVIGLTTVMTIIFAIIAAITSGVDHEQLARDLYSQHEVYLENVGYDPLEIRVVDSSGYSFKCILLDTDVSNTYELLCNK